MFNKSPENLWNALFNIPQGLTMTIAVSLFLGHAELVSLCRTFACAYCAGVMLTLLLRIPAFGALIARLCRCREGSFPEYIVSGLAGGALMGVLMNFFMTFMAIGPVPEFPAAYFHALPFSMLVSAVSSCVWVALVNRIVARVYGGKPAPLPYDPAAQEPAVRRSVCTGEMTVGFIDRDTGVFHDYMCVRDQTELEEFCRSIGVKDIRTIY